MTSIDAKSDQLFEKFLQYLKRLGPFVPEQTIQGLYNAIEDNRYIDLELSNYSEKYIALPKAEPNSASFLFSDGANVSVVVFTGVLYLELCFKGKASGTTSQVIAKAIGKLYYNNLNNLTNGCDFECNFRGCLSLRVSLHKLHSWQPNLCNISRRCDATDLDRRGQRPVEFEWLEYFPFTWNHVIAKETLKSNAAVSLAAR